MKYLRHGPLLLTFVLVLSLGAVVVAGAVVSDKHGETPHMWPAAVRDSDVGSWWERVREANRLTTGTDSERAAWSGEARRWAQETSEHSSGNAALLWARAAVLAYEYANVSGDQAQTVVTAMAALADRAGGLSHGLTLPAIPIEQAVVEPTTAP